MERRRKKAILVKRGFILFILLFILSVVSKADIEIFDNLNGSGYNASFNYYCNATSCHKISEFLSAGQGDISGVVAGVGIEGGGQSGNVTISLNQTLINKSIGDNITKHENTFKHGNTTPEITGLFDSGDGNITYSNGVFTLIKLDLAQFTNSLGWITNTVSNLVNYFTKTETNALLADINSTINTKLNITDQRYNETIRIDSLNSTVQTEITNRQNNDTSQYGLIGNETANRVNNDTSVRASVVANATATLTTAQDNIDKNYTKLNNRINGVNNTNNIQGLGFPLSSSLPNITNVFLNTNYPNRTETDNKYVQVGFTNVTYDSETTNWDKVSSDDYNTNNFSTDYNAQTDRYTITNHSNELHTDVRTSITNNITNVNASMKVYVDAQDTLARDSIPNNITKHETTFKHGNTTADILNAGFNITTDLKAYFDTLYTSAAGLFNNDNFTTLYFAQTDRYTDANISGSETAFNGWDKVSSDDYNTNNFSTDYNAQTDRYTITNHSNELHTDVRTSITNNITGANASMKIYVDATATNTFNSTNDIWQAISNQTWDSKISSVGDSVIDNITNFQNNSIVRSYNTSWLNTWYSGIGYYTNTNFTTKYATMGAFGNTNFSTQYAATNGRYTLANLTSDLANNPVNSTKDFNVNKKFNITASTGLVSISKNISVGECIVGKNGGAICFS